MKFIVIDEIALVIASLLDVVNKTLIYKSCLKLTILEG